MKIFNKKGIITETLDYNYIKISDTLHFYNSQKKNLQQNCTKWMTNFPAGLF